MYLRIPVRWDHEQFPDLYHPYINGITIRDLRNFSSWYSHNILGAKKDENLLPVDMFRQNLFTNMPISETFRTAGEDEPFLWPLHHSYTQYRAASQGWLEHLISYLTIPPHVIANVMALRAAILLFNSWEAWPNSYWQRFIAAICGKYPQLNAENFIILNQNLAMDESLHGIGYCAFQEVCIMPNDISEVITKRILSRHSRPNRYICLNRIPRYHRFYALTKLWPDRDKGALSFVFNLDELGWNQQEKLDHYANDYRQYIQAQLSNANSSASYHVKMFLEHCCNDDIKQYYIHANISNHLPLLIDDGIDGRVNPAYDNSHTKFFDSYLHIVTETNGTAYEGEIFLTEKIFKPVQFMQPFVLIAGQGYLSKFRELGYQTFDRWIDESYDDIVNHDDRYERALNSAKQFYDQEPDVLDAIMVEMLPILTHNYQTLQDNVKQLQSSVHSKLQTLLPWKMK